MLLLLTVLVTGVAVSPSYSRRPQTLSHSAYIWQRQWTSALRQAIAESSPYVTDWRVLAAEADFGRKPIAEIAIDAEALRRSARPVVAVFRFDGHLEPPTLDSNIPKQISLIVARWRQESVPVKGVEIDYDCPARRLPAYRQFLHLLRSQLAADLLLSITALPSWMDGSPAELVALLREVNESVLQVHSVSHPSSGLFKSSRAAEWSQRWSSITPGPFRLALPTYWSQVTWADNGRVLAIESEIPRLGSDVDAHDLLISPSEVASLLTNFRRSPIPRLTGIAWFRLPTNIDRRAWSSATWHAVLQDRPLPLALPDIRLQVDPSGSSNVYLRNSTAQDQPLPAMVRFPAGSCELADALPPYSLDRRTRELDFVLSQHKLLAPGHQRLIGWVRCSSTDPEAHASF